ncbi:MAG: hypothetical protein WBG30_10710 [Psychrilyobacter sp.]|uniref:hypothetical protein n=1 Tax=Psychrilyobacter sp. TaxID=2586924 RepID=UPI003C722BE9
MGKTLATENILSKDLNISERHVREIFKEFKTGEYYDYRACVQKFVRNSKLDTSENVTQKKISDLFGVSEKTIRNLTSENILEKNEKEMYNLKLNFKKYIEKINKNNELREIKAESEKMKLKILKDEYLPVYVITDALKETIFNFRNYLLGISQKITIEIEEKENPNINKIVENRILKALEELSKFDLTSNKDI